MNPFTCETAETLNVKQEVRKKCLLNFTWFLMLAFFGCNLFGPRSHNTTVLLSVLQDSTAGVQLKVSFTDRNDPRGFNVKRDGDTVAVGKLFGIDTILTDVHVLQTQTYSYRAYRINGSRAIDSSEEVRVTIGHGWTVDTVKEPHGGQLILDQLWGPSSDRVFAIGHNSDGYRYLWEWDGKKWSIFQPNPTDTYQHGVWDLYGIWGADENNFWVVGWMNYVIYDTTDDSIGFMDTDSSFIGHWDGVRWTKQDAFGGRPLFYIWGSSGMDIYASGWKSSLFHYDGTAWHKIAPDDTTMDYERIWGRSASEVFCIRRKLIPPYGSQSWKYLLRLSPTGYSILDSTFDDGLQPTKFGTIGIWGTETNTYSWGTGIFESAGSSWNLIFNPPYQVGDVKGISDDSLYAAGSFGSMYFYDGKSWNRPAGFPYVSTNIQFASIWVNSSEVFILGYDGWTSYVYHYK